MFLFNDFGVFFHGVLVVLHGFHGLWCCLWGDFFYLLPFTFLFRPFLESCVGITGGLLKQIQEKSKGPRKHLQSKVVVYDMYSVCCLVFFSTKTGQMNCKSFYLPISFCCVQGLGWLCIVCICHLGNKVEVKTLVISLVTTQCQPCKWQHGLDLLILSRLASENPRRTTYHFIRKKGNVASEHGWLDDVGCLFHPFSIPKNHEIWQENLRIPQP